jgi:hypothetical protein
MLQIREIDIHTNIHETTWNTNTYTLPKIVLISSIRRLELTGFIEHNNTF